jgi:hypothetical protein
MREEHGQNIRRLCPRMGLFQSPHLSGTAIARSLDLEGVPGERIRLKTTLDFVHILWFRFTCNETLKLLNEKRE